MSTQYPGKILFITLTTIFTIACNQNMSAPDDETPMSAPTSQNEKPCVMDMGTQMIPQTPTLDSTTPCPPLLYPPEIYEYSRAYYLTEHPNPKCDRDLVCVPLAISSTLPLCQWLKIRRGEENQLIWLKLNSGACDTPGYVGSVESRESDFARAWYGTFQTCSWNLYRGDSPTRPQLIETKAPPGSPVMTPKTLRRLRFGADRNVYIETCPPTDENTRNWPYDINCLPWSPAKN